MITTSTMTLRGRSAKAAALNCFSYRSLGLLGLLLLILLIQPSVEAEALALMSDAEIQSAFMAGCGRDHPIEKYQGLGRRHDVVGPLWLDKAGEKRPRGVILPPFLRVFLEGRARGCKHLDLEALRELAGSEIWVVLWRTEDPPSPPFRSSTTSDQKILRPTEVKLRQEGAWHRAAWTRNRDPWVRGWYGEDWNEKESLLAGFSFLAPTGALHVDYKVEEDGRNYLTDSAIFSLTTFPEKWWAAAHGEERR